MRERFNSSDCTEVLRVSQSILEYVLHRPPQEVTACQPSGVYYAPAYSASLEPYIEPAVPCFLKHWMQEAFGCTSTELRDQVLQSAPVRSKLSSLDLALDLCYINY